MIYQFGEVVLMEWHGWLRAFKVLEVHQTDEENVEYRMAPVDLEGGPQWTLVP